MEDVVVVKLIVGSNKGIVDKLLFFRKDLLLFIFFCLFKMLDFKIARNLPDAYM